MIMQCSDWTWYNDLLMNKVIFRTEWDGVSGRVEKEATWNVKRILSLFFFFKEFGGHRPAAFQGKRTSKQRIGLNKDNYRDTHILTKILSHKLPFLLPSLSGNLFLLLLFLFFCFSFFLLTFFLSCKLILSPLNPHHIVKSHTTVDL